MEQGADKIKTESYTCTCAPPWVPVLFEYYNRCIQSRPHLSQTNRVLLYFLYFTPNPGISDNCTASICQLPNGVLQWNSGLYVGHRFRSDHMSVARCKHDDTSHAVFLYGPSRHAITHIHVWPDLQKSKSQKSEIQLKFF